MDLGYKQKTIINKASKYIFENSKTISSELSSYCFLGILDETPGWSKIKLFEKGWSFLPKYFFVLFKHILGVGFLNDYLLHGNKSLDPERKTLIISWSFEKNFSSNGSFNDRYLSENSKNNKNIQWVLISMDNFIPENLDDNVLIIKQKPNKPKFNVIFFIRNFIENLIKNRFSIKKLLHYLPSHSVQALKLSDIILNNLSLNNFSKVFLPYESQPFQNFIFSRIKKIKKNITTIGYVHSMLPSLPTNYIFRKGSPDILLVHGEGQKDILEKFLGWPNQKVKVIESLRYRHESNKSLANKIFIPYALFKSDILIKKFEKFLQNSDDKSLPNFEVLNHPTKNNSKKHLFFFKNIKKIIDRYQDKFDHTSKRKLSICFGWTAAVVEALEREIEVVHICSDPVLESFNEKIWLNFEVKKIDNFIFKYKLSFPNKYINFGKKNNLLKNCLEDIK